LKKCPHCGGKVEQAITAPAIQFKGSGWYVTDYAGEESGERFGGAEKSDGERARRRTRGAKEGAAKERRKRKNRRIQGTRRPRKKK